MDSSRPEKISPTRSILQWNPCLNPSNRFWSRIGYRSRFETQYINGAWRYRWCEGNCGYCGFNDSFCYKMCYMFAREAWTTSKFNSSGKSRNGNQEISSNFSTKIHRKKKTTRPIALHYCPDGIAICIWCLDVFIFVTFFDFLSGIFPSILMNPFGFWPSGNISHNSHFGLLLVHWCSTFSGTISAISALTRRR